MQRRHLALWCLDIDSLIIADSPRTIITYLCIQIIPEHSTIIIILLHSVQDLYYDFHPEAGILFASIPDFADYYEEEESNNQGIECMRLLNEIFGDFDQLLTDKRFQSIEKIKTIGSTYMVASGVNQKTVSKCSFKI